MRMLTAAAVVLWAAVSAVAADSNQVINVQKRSRVEQPGGTWAIQEKPEAWVPAETAIIVCDVWDTHSSLNAVRRVVEMAPRMNAVLTKARELGALIIHAPSGCMPTYQDHPGRKLAQSAPKAGNLPKDIALWCRSIPAEEQATYPIDQVTKADDDDPEERSLWQAKLTELGRNPKGPWIAESSLLTIDDRDAISDSGVEIWNLLESRNIKNVILLGVHTNMCVLGRPFGLRQMAKNGKNVVLMRDMTDTMYDPAQWPYVNHFTGTHLIIEHIEKYVAPSITSVAFLGGEAFRFARDKRKVLMLIGDDEYKTEVSLPAFAESDLKPLGFDVQIIHADTHDKNKFPGMAEAIKAADVVLVSVRRRLPPKEDLDALRQHVAAGKPIVGIRTACHAWCLRTEKDNQAAAEKGQGVWPEFDPEVLGGHYVGHHGADVKTAITVAETGKSHAILRGVDLQKFVGNGSLYRVNPLVETTTPLLIGTVPEKQPEPVAWTNMAGPKKVRVFNTTLGHLEDFQEPAFRKLLTNAIFWVLAEPWPSKYRLEDMLPTAVK